jgi:hypothetical protein
MRVSNHEATLGPSSFETPAAQAPQDEEIELHHLPAATRYASRLWPAQ